VTEGLIVLAGLLLAIGLIVFANLHRRGPLRRGDQRDGGTTSIAGDGGKNDPDRGGGWDWGGDSGGGDGGGGD